MEKSKLDLVAFGCALSAAEVGSLRNFIEGVVASAIFGWITAAVLVTIYNSLVRS